MQAITEAWAEHRHIVDAVAKAEQWRACIGWGVAPVRQDDSDACCQAVGSHVFISNGDLAWFTICDIPVQAWYGARKLVQWGEVRQAVAKYGMPTLTKQAIAGWNLSVKPGEGHRDALDPEQHAVEAKILNAINWAMTSSAVLQRSKWGSVKQTFCEKLGLSEPAIMTGEGTIENTQPVDWAPRPYLAFDVEKHRSLVSLFDAATLPIGGKDRYYIDPFKLRFCKDLDDGMPIRSPAEGTLGQPMRNPNTNVPMLSIPIKGSGRSLTTTTRVKLKLKPGDKVEIGQVIGHDAPIDGLPDGWADAYLYQKWDRFLMRGKCYPPFMVEEILRAWFTRHCLLISGKYVHVPAELAGVAAIGTAIDEALIWDLGPIMDYYNEPCNAFIFPPVRIGQWDRFKGKLLDIPYDVQPHDSRFMSREEKLDEVKWHGTETGRTGPHKGHLDIPKGMSKEEAIKRSKQKKKAKPKKASA